MARVEWTRLSGDDVEEAVAIMVSRKHPDSIRIRPSKGDGGIDILVPLPDETFHVLQVKKFAQNLKAGEKRQITRSLARLSAFVRDEGLAVSKWSLVTPLDPTKENLVWLAEQPALPDMVVDWKGLNFVEALVSEFPEVVDYHLHNGKERLAAALADLTALLRGPLTGSDPTAESFQASDAPNLLEALFRQVNLHDPHYSYDLYATTNPIELDSLDHKFLVFATQSYGSPSIAIAVRARFADAPNVREIPLSLKIRVPAEGELRDRLEEFHEFGGDLDLPAEAVELTADLPGGLGPTPGAPTAVRIRALGEPARFPQDMLLVIMAPDGSELASVTVELTTVIRGSSGVSGYLRGQEINGAFDVTVRLDVKNQKQSFRFSLREPQGSRLESLRDGFKFLANFRAPNQLCLRNPLRTTGSEPMPIADPGDASASTAYDVLEALIRIQAIAGRTIRMPKLLDRPVTDFAPWIEAAHLLEGKPLQFAWDELSFTPPAAPAEFIDTLPAALMVRDKLTISVDGLELDLGFRQFYTPAVHLKPGAVIPERGGQVTLVPYGDSGGILTWAPHDEQ
ncbi:hypothetical protein [Kitasatospora sp. NPDC090308]|uniref:hypothetical protein n=1 Tax=Kitasatospora sp. NPDC090308 TaxID=3364082 RepID=UPI0038144E22